MCPKIIKTRTPASIADKIRFLRTEAGLSLTEFQEKAGLSLAYLSKLESGKYSNNLSLPSASALAKGLGLSLKDFLSKIGYPEDNGNRPSIELIKQALRGNGYSDQEATKIIEYARFIKKQE